MARRIKRGGARGMSEGGMTGRTVIWHLSLLGALGALAAGGWIAYSFRGDPASDRVGCLSFHEVHPRITVAEAERNQVPAGYKVLLADRGTERLLVREIPIVLGSEVTDAEMTTDPILNLPIISFRFNEVGARKFGQFTTENVGRPLVVVLDERVVSAPVIRMPILEGQGQISGNLTAADARQLAAKLRSGTCP
jgi:SecD/SecF fusion protein